MTDADRWLTLPEAARLAGVSERTMRRRIHAGEVTAELREGRWMVAADTSPASGMSLVPVEVFDRLEALNARLVEAETARARAEVTAAFQVERRREIEMERDRLAAEVEALRNRRWWRRKSD